MLNLWLEPRIPTSYMAADVKKIWQELNGAGCKDVDSLGWLDCAEATASSLPLIMEKPGRFVKGPTPSWWLVLEAPTRLHGL